MKIHNDISNLPLIKNPVVTIGTFDGVHIGHQKILQKINSIAKEINGDTVLITFYPHPREIVDKNFSIGLISNKIEKEEKLNLLGLDHLIYIPFTKEFSEMSAYDFVKKNLVDSIHLNTIVVGYDHRFGNNREGDIDFLRKLSEKFSFNVNEIPAQIIEETKVSSSKIRTVIIEGNIEMASTFLNENYSIRGYVVKGKQIGSKLNFPTANIKIDDENKLLPKIGVYAVKVILNSITFFGMLNIGYKPSVSSDKILSIEVNIFDFSENIYDEELKIYFIKRIRDEIKFNSLDELKLQLKKDEKVCRSLLFNISTN